MTKFLNVSIALFCLCGVCLSGYAIYIVRAKTLDRNFQATCDIDQTISCTHALLSDYSKGFGVVGKILGKDHFLNLPNSFMGLGFFPLMFLLSLSSKPLFHYLALILALGSTVISAYLIYVLVYVLETICLVCLPVHFINIALLFLFTLKDGRTPNPKNTPKKKAATKSDKKNNKND